MSEAVAAEPLVRLDDIAEYRAGLNHALAGDWDDERWTAYRVRFGVYGQRQPGVQMVRIKIPGGIVPVPWLKTLARVNRDFAVGDAHITTRQDFQIYHVPLARSADLLAELAASGITTREACGNTLRNMTACALAGACPRELVDAGTVSANLARSWLRHPLVQHMPRKMKITVSGCSTDCGGSAIHDLAFIAVERDGARGFRVLAGGGLGATPRPAVEVLDFVTEDTLPAVVEAAVRLHQRYSDRTNRNASRIKFLVKRFGEEKFVALFREEYARLTGLAQRPWPQLAWRNPTQAAVARTPVGALAAHDGTVSVVVAVPLGLLSSDQLDALHTIAVTAGVRELRTTRDQNLALLGVAPDQVATVTAAVRAIGFDVPAMAEDVPEIISCPGTTTCRIGITNSQTFARQVAVSASGDAAARGVSVHVSGCQNSCGLHHVADIGLHGMAKKIEGRSAPHYQIHLGGDLRSGSIGLTGPVVPARLAVEAVRLLRSGWVDGRNDGESLRDWAERLGRDGLATVLAGINGADADGLFVDWGEATAFAGAPQTRGECAAPFASDDLLADLADDALIAMDRYVVADRLAEGIESGDRALVFAARRLLGRKGHATTDDLGLAQALESLRSVWGEDAAFDTATTARTHVAEAGGFERYREAVAVVIDTVRGIIEAPVEAAVGDLAAILGAAE
jgi:sulfite reductase beta subunit-like hemoprotein